MLDDATHPRKNADAAFIVNIGMIFEPLQPAVISQDCFFQHTTVKDSLKFKINDEQ